MLPYLYQHREIQYQNNIRGNAHKVIFPALLRSAVKEGGYDLYCTGFGQGRRQRGASGARPSNLKLVPPHFTFAPTVATYIVYFKNVPSLLVFGASFWFLAPLLLNPGDGPGFGCIRVRVTRGFPQPPSPPTNVFNFFCAFDIFHFFVLLIFFVYFFCLMVIFFIFSSFYNIFILIIFFHILKITFYFELLSKPTTSLLLPVTGCRRLRHASACHVLIR